MTENEIKSIVNDRFQHRAAINEKEFKKKNYETSICTI